MKKDKIQEAYEQMINEKFSMTDVKQLKRRVEEIGAVVKANESPFELLSGLKSDIKEMMKRIR